MYPAVETPTTGRLLGGRYRLEQRLAAGGFGTVYRATACNGGEVAIKIMHPQHVADSNVSARFRREAHTLARLASPHTVATYELGEDRDGALYIVMELLRGESLQDRFAAQGPLGWRTVLEVARGVCSSLVEAHGLGIVHRDLKPANIFLAHSDGDRSFAKVLDFGIAKQLGPTTNDCELTRVGQAIGTVEYMAPEQLIGGEVDGRADIYTLGVVMYEMLTGQRPFADTTGATSLVTAVMTRPVTPPSALIGGAVPRELDAVIVRCLAREPDDRYGSVDELAAALDHMLSAKDLLSTTQRLWLRMPSAVSVGLAETSLGFERARRLAIGSSPTIEYFEQANRDHERPDTVVDDPPSRRGVPAVVRWLATGLTLGAVGAAIGGLIALAVS